jgi:8-oxo-dGTP pyrophosphatase MutT (NUDIX family)
MTPVISDAADRLRRALDRPAGLSSDFDLNPADRPDRKAPLLAAAVLVALAEGPSGPVVYLTKRASGLRHHPGQISLPGGKCEPDDADAVAAALREAEEEIALPRDAVQVIGTLPPHETVTGFHITPVLATIARAFDPVPQVSEVAEVFSVPFDHLMDPARYGVERRMWRGAWRSYYVVPWGPYYIWGATARILRGLAERAQG